MVMLMLRMVMNDDNGKDGDGDDDGEDDNNDANGEGADGDDNSEDINGEDDDNLNNMTLAELRTMSIRSGCTGALVNCT